MKTSQLTRMIPSVLFLFGLSLIVSGLGSQALRAEFHVTDDFDNERCVEENPDPSCANCPSGVNECVNVISDGIVEGFCDPDSGSFGISCEEGWWDCGKRITCDEDRTVTEFDCSPVTGLCQDDA